MSKHLKKMIADKTTYPDTFSFKLPDGTDVTIGDLRADLSEHDGELTASVAEKMTELETRKTQLVNAEKEVLGYWDNYLKLTGLTAEEALAGKKPKTAAAVSDETGLDESDPIVGQMVKIVNGLKAEVDGLKGKFSTTEQNVLKPMLNTYLDDYYSDRFEDRILPKLPEKAREKVTLESVLAHAQKEGYKDSKGRLNLDRAAKDLAEPFTLELTRAQIREEERKNLRNEMAMESMDRPGSRNSLNNPRNGTPKSFKNEKGQTKSFDEALQMAMSDDEILSQIGSTAGGVA